MLKCDLIDNSSKPDDKTGDPGKTQTCLTISHHDKKVCSFTSHYPIELMEKVKSSIEKAYAGNKTYFRANGLCPRNGVKHLMHFYELIDTAYDNGVEDRADVKIK